MVGKVSERVLLREGLERTDNGMKQSSWPDVTPINQKNYYTDYMKRDDQTLALRLQGDATRDRLVQTAKDRDRALARSGNAEVPLIIPELHGEDGPSETSGGTDASKIIVIHPGSQNLRIGFASDALPKTIPMALATKFPQTESEMYEALPRRQFEAKTTEQQYGEEWSKKYTKVCNDLKTDMRQNKRKVLPNSKELVLNYNRRSEPDVIPQHNDPLQIEWTDIHTLDDPESPASCFIGNQALRVPDDSQPKFKLWWPIRHGWLNEDEYTTAEHLHDDLETLLDKAIRQELGLTKSSTWRQYSCVFVIPDLYDKKYVEQVLKSCANWFEFNKICFIQESMAATFGAGYTQACVVDVGAQKTSVTCVEDGLCIEDSRINLKYGGYDVTEAFIKMMLYDNFPYQEINLQRRYDFLLAEELKIKHCTMSQADISVQLYQFHVRAPNKPTHKYQFKTYDEVILAPMGFFDPDIFDNSTKIRGRRKLLDRSYNAYDVDVPDDPTSAAQFAILALVNPSLNAATAANGPSQSGPSQSGPSQSLADVSTPVKEKLQPFDNLKRGESGLNGTPSGSKAPSPAPEGGSTPVPPPFIFTAGKDGIGGGSPAPSLSARNGGGGGTPAPSASQPPPPGISVEAEVKSAKAVAMERDGVLPIAPLDLAILTSIHNAARGDDKKLRDYLGSIMVIGGGAKVPQFTAVLEEKLKARRPDLLERILVSRSARDMDEQVVVWKGASVFAKLPTNDSWITPFEFERLGSRVLHHKVLWACSISFVITDLIGVKKGVGDIVGTLGFADEVVALVACPVWGLASDRLGVRWVAVMGYAIIGLSLFLFVQARNVYPQLLLARIFFAFGSSAATTMVTAILPPLTDDSDASTTDVVSPVSKPAHNPRLSVAMSLESDMTITPERYRSGISDDGALLDPAGGVDGEKPPSAKPSALAGYVGLFTGSGALVALSVFLPLPARFGDMDGVTPAEAITDSFYVVGAVSLAVAVFVFLGLRGLKGEDGKGWSLLLGRKDRDGELSGQSQLRRFSGAPDKQVVVPYLRLLRDSVTLGFTDANIALGYLGGFVARASTVAISLFVPLFINTYFIKNGFCRGSPHDPSPELKKECRAAYLLASILTGVAQLVGLLCAPAFGYLSRRQGAVNLPIVVSTLSGIVAYIIFPQLASPEYKDVDGRGGHPVVFLVVALLGLSQIGAIVCSLGSLGQGVLTADVPRPRPDGMHAVEESTGDFSARDEDAPLLDHHHAEGVGSVSRIRLKGSIAGVYSWCGGAAILILAKLGGYLFDNLSTGAPFYMMALFNGALLAASLGIDMGRVFGSR
ncbi:actin-like ATPase domain-containing protein [Sodiomyces alkalinus F11]|uniref:Actin-like ATPase domain-containing protein n=1 Tax=Sodiomyces alkalinus (strain CBS 110278 / VKM F-3762 / F11) TaxID=1314773 RepID=A0A3N2PVP9_SODAK|nr:actin-like ATPase domain-containing protein [Sodiomyces alkalinus F11]ROT38552.1 actin-like ATPase domain-containing protein [Sodiomyces alkalinus F11]